MNENTLLRALADAYAALGTLRDPSATQDAAQTLSGDELRQATLLLAAIGHQGWAVARCLGWAHGQDVAGRDAAAQGLLAAVAQHFADAGSAAAALGWRPSAPPVSPDAAGTRAG